MHRNKSYHMVRTSGGEGSALTVMLLGKVHLEVGVVGKLAGKFLD